MCVFDALLRPVCECVRVYLYARASGSETFRSQIQFSPRMLRLGPSALPAFCSQAVGR